MYFSFLVHEQLTGGRAQNSSSYSSSPNPYPSPSQLCPCAMATTDTCANCARGLTFPLSPVHLGWRWDQVSQGRKYKTFWSFRKLKSPPCFHIYFTLGIFSIPPTTEGINIHISGILGFICFWLLLLLRIYLPESYWSWSHTINIEQWVSGSWRNWKLYGRFQTGFNSTQIFSKFKFEP